MIINEILDACKDFNKVLVMISAEVNHLQRTIAYEDDVTQDYLHQLELCTTTSSGRAKIATQLKHSRQRRRDAKDQLAVLLPLYDFLNNNEVIAKQFPQVYGNMKKIANNQNNRMYIPKAVKSIEEEFRK